MALNPDRGGRIFVIARQLGLPGQFQDSQCYRVEPKFHRFSNLSTWESEAKDQMFEVTLGYIA